MRIATFLLGLLLLASTAAAFPQGVPIPVSEVEQAYSEAKLILMHGGYADLVEYREETGYDFYPEIKDVFDFYRARRDVRDRYPYLDFDEDEEVQYRYVPGYYTRSGHLVLGSAYHLNYNSYYRDSHRRPAYERQTGLQRYLSNQRVRWR